MMFLGFAAVGFMAYRRSRKDQGVAVAADRSNLQTRERAAASSSHDGVKWAVFPEFGARDPCGFKKIANATPMGGVMDLPSQTVPKVCAAADRLQPNASNILVGAGFDSVVSH